VHDDGTVKLLGDSQLRFERTPLRVAWRMIVVVVKPALSHRNRAFSHVPPNRFQVAHLIEIHRVVRMDARGMIDVPRVVRGDCGGSIGRGNRLPDGYNGCRTGITSASNHVVAIDIERGVREVGVAIDVAHTSEHRREHRGGVVVSEVSGWRHVPVVDRAWPAALPESRFSTPEPRPCWNPCR
jgi:hypothetical protein